jgi:hypothetical protein
MRSVDVDEQRPVAKSFGVRSVPFVALLRHGAWFSWDDALAEPVPLPAARYEGALQASALAEWLNNRRVLATRRTRAPYLRHVLTPPRRALRRSTGLAVPWRVDVEELTPQTLREAIEDPSVDILVEFYGASCARCTEFEQQYRAVRTMPRAQLRARA